MARSLLDSAILDNMTSPADARLFRESRKSASTTCWSEWLDELMCDSSTESRDVFDPKTMLYTCLSLFKNLLPNDMTVTTTTVEVKDLLTCLAKIRLATDMFPSKPPSMFTNFQEGWLLDMKNPVLYTRRQMYSKQIEMKYFAHLRSNINVASLPNLCDEECGCVLQQSPVGDRGGIPRRSPCAQKGLAHLPPMTRTTIIFVSINYCILFASSNTDFLYPMSFPYLSYLFRRPRNRTSSTCGKEYVSWNETSQTSCAPSELGLATSKSFDITNYMACLFPDLSRLCRPT